MNELVYIALAISMLVNVFCAYVMHKGLKQVRKMKSDPLGGIGEMAEGLLDGVAEEMMEDETDED